MTINPAQEILFPQQKKPEKNQVLLTALISGRLILSGKCLRIELTDVAEIYTPIWPYQYVLEKTNKTLVIKNGEMTVAKLGFSIEIGGGEIKDIDNTQVFDHIKETLKQCPAPYWLASDSQLK